MFNLLTMELRRFAGNKVVPLLLLLFGAFIQYTLAVRNSLLSLSIGFVFALNVPGMMLAVMEEAIGSPGFSRYLL